MPGEGGAGASLRAGPLQALPTESGQHLLGNTFTTLQVSKQRWCLHGSRAHRMLQGHGRGRFVPRQAGDPGRPLAMLLSAPSRQPLLPVPAAATIFSAAAFTAAESACPENPCYSGTLGDASGAHYCYRQKRRQGCSQLP